MLKYLNDECKKFKCCICANYEHCLGRSDDYFVLVSKGVLNDRLLSSPHRYSSIEKILMRDVLNDMVMEEIETKEKECMENKNQGIGSTKEQLQLMRREHLNRERVKAYKQGLEEAWEIARKVAFDLDTATLRGIFDRMGCSILRDISIHEVKEKIEAWEKEQAKPKLGDVVKIGDIGEFLFLGEGIEHYYVLDPSDNDGIPHQFVKKHTVNNIKKTGKHFDIQTMLDEIG